METAGPKLPTDRLSRSFRHCVGGGDARKKATLQLGRKKIRTLERGLLQQTYGFASPHGFAEPTDAQTQHFRTGLSDGLSLSLNPRPSTLTPKAGCDIVLASHQLYGMQTLWMGPQRVCKKCSTSGTSRHDATTSSRQTLALRIGSHEPNILFQRAG